MSDEAHAVPTSKRTTRAIDRRGGALLAAVLALCAPLAFVAAPSGASAPVTARSLVAAELTDTVNISSDGPSHVEITTLNVKPGTSTIWHSHARPTMVSVKEGAATVYAADATGCTRREQPAGSAFVEKGGQVHAVRNEGKEPLIMYVVFVVPSGTDLGAPAAAPAGCSFAPLG